MKFADPTRIALSTDPLTQRLKGVARHGYTPFDVPYISEVGRNLWQGGCTEGLILPDFIKHVVSLYPWERYEINHTVDSELYVEMFDSEDQATEVDEIAAWVNSHRGQPVLIHCQAGLNRSSLVAARALFLGGDFETGAEIISHLREARSPAVLCNKAFDAEVRSWKHPNVAYMLREKGSSINALFLGGGSSTPASPRIYETESQAERMRKRYFPNTVIQRIEW